MSILSPSEPEVGSYLILEELVPQSPSVGKSEFLGVKDASKTEKVPMHAEVPMVTAEPFSRLAAFKELVLEELMFEPKGGNAMVGLLEDCDVGLSSEFFLSAFEPLWQLRGVGLSMYTGTERPR